MAASLTGDDDFFVKLAQPNHGYRPGETIHGSVIAKAMVWDSERPPVVHIALEGCAKSTLTSNEKNASSAYRSRVPLVYAVKLLEPVGGYASVKQKHETHEDPYATYELAGDNATNPSSPSVDVSNASEPSQMTDDSASTVSHNTSTTPQTPTNAGAEETLLPGTQYLFSFTLPFLTQDLRTTPPFNTTYWSHVWPENSDKFSKDPGHPIPSSLKFGPRGSYLKSSGVVEYKLVASQSWVRSEVDKNKGEEQEVEPFRFAQCGFWVVDKPQTLDANNLPRLPASTHVNFKTYRLVSQGSGSGLTFKQSTKMLFKSAEVPSVKTRIDQSIPQSLFIGKIFDLQIEIFPPTQERDTWKERNWTELDPNSLMIEAVHIKVKRFVKVRASAKMDHFNDLVLEKKYSGINPANPLEAVERNKQGFPTVTIRCGPLSKELRPSTSTANLVNSYEVHTDIKVSCAGETKTVSQSFAVPIGYQGKPSQTPTKIQRKPVGAARVSMSQPQANATEIDELEDMGAYRLDQEEISPSSQTLTGALKNDNHIREAMQATSIAR